jgi:predicted transcriptional regulator
MLTRTERILLALKDRPMTVKEAQSRFACTEAQAQSALAALASNGRARSEKVGSHCIYHLTETGRQKIEDMEHAKADKTRRAAGLFKVAERPRMCGGWR